MPDASLQVVIEATDRASVVVRQVTSNLESQARRIREVGRELTFGLTLPIAGFGAAALKSSTDYETGFAQVRRTVGGTQEQLAALSGEILAMAREIPVTTVELNRIAAAAGQLGVQREAIGEFTRTVAAMAATTNLSAADAANAFARIGNVMGVAAHDFDRMGSTVLQLGVTSAASEAEIADFALRIAGAGRIANISTAQVFAISAAMASVGVQAEAGGTAVQRMLIAMTRAVQDGGDQLQVFAAISGMTATEFARRWHTDAAGAFTAFVEGLGKAGDDAFQVLDEIGLADARVIRSFLSLGNAGDLLRSRLEEGTKAWQDNKALTEATATIYGTTQAKLAVFRNELAEVAKEFGDSLAPALIAVLEAMKPLLAVLEQLARLFANLPKPIQIAAVTIVALAALSGPVMLGLGAVLGAVNALRIAWDSVALSAGRAGVAMAGASAAGMGAGAAGAAAGAGAVAGGGLIGAALASPLLPIAAGVTGLIALWQMYKDDVSDAADATAQLRQRVEELNARGANIPLTGSYKELLQAVTNVNIGMLDAAAADRDAAKAEEKAAQAVSLLAASHVNAADQAARQSRLERELAEILEQNTVRKIVEAREAEIEAFHKGNLEAVEFGMALDNLADSESAMALAAQKGTDALASQARANAKAAEEAWKVEAANRAAAEAESRRWVGSRLAVPSGAQFEALKALLEPMRAEGAPTAIQLTPEQIEAFGISGRANIQAGGWAGIADLIKVLARMQQELLAQQFFGIGSLAGQGRISPVPGSEEFVAPFQHGGIVMKPTLALLGEKGPEAVVPLATSGRPINIVLTIDGRQIAQVLGVRAEDAEQVRSS